MTLPTREEADGILILHNVQVANNSDGMAIVEAYVGGVLLTAAEWRDTIDYEAAEAVMEGTAPGKEQYMHNWKSWTKAIVDAALGNGDE